MSGPGKIILISQANTSRLEYVTGFLSSGMGIVMEMIQAGEFEGNYTGTEAAVIHYGPKPMEGAFSIFASGLLSETGIRNTSPGVYRDRQGTFLFQAPAGFDLGFDMFSAVFYLLSRYEEYLPYIPDPYGRFEADQSLAFVHGFLEEPVIDQWIHILKNKLVQCYPGLQFPEQKFRYVSTFDIDNPWAYLHKGILRTSGGLVRAIINSDFEDVRARVSVLMGRRPDPNDTYSYIKNMEKKYGFSSVFFLLAGNYGGYDTNYALNSAYFKELVNDLRSGGSIGIHPSYKSHLNYRLLKSEYDHFSGISGQKTELCRQHFLLLRLPESYRQLVLLGIKEDYTMGYASHEGFRASTGNPFPFYDLLKEVKTDLMIHPFALMDVTLRQYRLLSAGEAGEQIAKIADTVKKVNGIFTSLWHNESLSESGIWKGWRKVYEEMVKKVTGE